MTGIFHTSKQTNPCNFDIFSMVNILDFHNFQIAVLLLQTRLFEQDRQAPMHHILIYSHYHTNYGFFCDIYRSSYDL